MSTKLSFYCHFLYFCLSFWIGADANGIGTSIYLDLSTSDSIRNLLQNTQNEYEHFYSNAQNIAFTRASGPIEATLYYIADEQIQTPIRLKRNDSLIPNQATRQTLDIPYFNSPLKPLQGDLSYPKSIEESLFESLSQIASQWQPISITSSARLIHQPFKKPKLQSPRSGSNSSSDSSSTSPQPYHQAVLIELPEGSLALNSLHLDLKNAIESNFNLEHGSFSNFSFNSNFPFALIFVVGYLCSQHPYDLVSLNHPDLKINFTVEDFRLSAPNLGVLHQALFPLSM